MKTNESLKFIVKSWIDNSDTEPERIDITTAEVFYEWMKDSLPEGTTAKDIMSVWNGLLHK